VASFIGSPAMNFVECSGGLARGTREVMVAGTPAAVPEFHVDAPHERPTLGVRPEHVEVDDSAGLRGEVFGVEYMGARQILTIATAAGRLPVRTDNRLQAHVGERVGMRFRAESVVLFDPVTEQALPSALIPAAGHG
jgi:multiple sugar transport system ATP-binding protein